MLGLLVSGPALAEAGRGAPGSSRGSDASPAAGERPEDLSSDGDRPSDPSSEREIAPGIWILRSPEEDQASRRARVRQWNGIFESELRRVRSAFAALFVALERSSLATESERCPRLAQEVTAVRRALLLPSPEVRLDRVLVGSLERLESGAIECVAGRYLLSYRLMEEGRAGLDWIENRVARSLREPIVLPGLSDRE